MDLFTKPRGTPNQKSSKSSFLVEKCEQDSKFPSKKRALNLESEGIPSLSSEKSELDSLNFAPSVSHSPPETMSSTRRQIREERLATSYRLPVSLNQSIGGIRSLAALRAPSPCSKKREGGIQGDGNFLKRQSSSPGPNTSFERDASSPTARGLDSSVNFRKQMHSLRAELARSKSAAQLEQRKLCHQVGMLEQENSELKERNRELEGERITLLRKAKQVQLTAEETLKLEQKLGRESLKEKQAYVEKLSSAEELLARTKEELSKFQALAVTVVPFAAIDFPPNTPLQEQLTVACQHWISTLKQSSKQAEGEALPGSFVGLEQKRQLDYIKSLERQLSQHKLAVAIARSQKSNCALMAEENAALHKTLREYKAQEIAYKSAVANADLLKAKLNGVESLRNQVMVLRKSSANLESELQAVHSQKTKLEERLAVTECKLRQVERRADSEAKLRHIAETARGLSLQEASIYRAAVEVPVDANALERNGSKEPIGAVEGSSTDRATAYRELQSLLQKQSTEFDKLAREHASLMAAQGRIDSDPTSERVPIVESNSTLESLETLRKLVAALEAEKSVAEKQLVSLETQLEVLESYLGLGGFDASKTVVRQMKLNPASNFFAARQTSFELLKAENKELLDDLLRVQRAGQYDVESVHKVLSDSGRMVPHASLVRLQNELEGSQQQIAEKEKRLERLKEVFKEKTLEYRETVYTLLGYRLDIRPDGRVRLTSQQSTTAISSPGGQKCLVFEFGGAIGLDTGNGKPITMQAVTDLSQVSIDGKTGVDFVSEKMTQYISNQSSVPGFLASVTLALLR